MNSKALQLLFYITEVLSCEMFVDGFSIRLVTLDRLLV